MILTYYLNCNRCNSTNAYSNLGKEYEKCNGTAATGEVTNNLRAIIVGLVTLSKNFKKRVFWTLYDPVDVMSKSVSRGRFIFSGSEGLDFVEAFSTTRRLAIREIEKGNNVNLQYLSICYIFLTNVSYLDFRRRDIEIGK